jgi:hypothetical protein
MSQFSRNALALLVCTATMLGCESDQPFEPGAGDPDPSFARGAGTALVAPSNPSATAASASQIDVRWQDNSTNESRFEIHRSSGGPAGTYSLVASPGSNVTFYRDGGLQSATQYCYRIRAVRSTGKNSTFSPFSDAACGTTAASEPSMAPPSNLAVSGFSPTRIDLSWRDGSTDETRFEVFHSIAVTQTEFQFLSVVSQNVTTFSHPELIAGTEHCYKVRAVRVTGTIEVSSAFSNTVCAPTFPAPAYDLEIIPAGGGGIIITWSAIGLYFRIEKSTDSGASWSVAGTVYNTGMFVAEAQGDQPTCLRVINYNDSGEAAPSNIVCAVRPTSPSSLFAVTIDAETYELRWTDNSVVEDSYEVWMVTEDWSCTGEHSGVWSGESRLAVLPANSTSFRVGGVLGGDICGASASLEVRAVKDGSYTSGWYLIDP